MRLDINRQGIAIETTALVFNLARAAGGDTCARQERRETIKAGRLVLPDTGVLRTTLPVKEQHRIFINPVRQRPRIDAVTEPHKLGPGA
jgi:hypothetical protein